MAKSSADEIASYMLAQIKPHKPLYQEDIAWQIHRDHGGDFTYINDNGNVAISKDVLKAFRSISSATVVWERGDRCWRLREATDRGERQQD